MERRRTVRRQEVLPPRPPRHASPGDTARLLIGAQSEPSIDRAARLGDGIITLSNDHCQAYLDAVARHGRNAADAHLREPVGDRR
jgi:alkanesulfonate monooxygenase SsuD/methylene tetrahydromethanopterin reductase-like flavin-dependent oxidoreductase (luciferase family)